MDSILINLLFTIMFALVPFIVLALLPYTSVSLRRFSVPSLFIIFYLLFDYIGILPLYYEWDSSRVAIGVVDRAIILKMFICSSTALILIIFGFAYAHHVLGLKIDVISNRILVSANATQRRFVFYLSLLCGLILAAYIRQLDAIALFKALEGDYIGTLLARSNMGNAFEGKYWHYHIFFRLLLDYCVMFFFADYLIKRRCVSGLIGGGCFIAAVFSAIMAIEKGPLINLLIMLFLTYVIVKGGNYWQSATKYFTIMLTIILCLIYILFVGDRDLMYTVQSITSRVFTGQITPAYFYLDLFPRQIEYLWGASLPNPGGLLPFQNVPLTREVANIMCPVCFETGIVGSAPTVYWGEMYANFGPIAIIFSSFLVGMGLFAISHILLKLPQSPPVIAASVSLAMHYKDLTGTSLSNYFIDSALFAIAIVTCISILLNRKLLLSAESRSL